MRSAAKSWMAPDEVARALTDLHVRTVGCEDCAEDDLCPWHQGYREGTLNLLLRATVA